MNRRERWNRLSADSVLIDAATKNISVGVLERWNTGKGGRLHILVRLFLIPAGPKILICQLHSDIFTFSSTESFLDRHSDNRIYYYFFFLLIYLTVSANMQECVNATFHRRTRRAYWFELSPIWTE